VVGANGLSTLACDNTELVGVATRVVEAEDEVVVGEEGGSLDCAAGKDEALEESLVGKGQWGRAGCAR